MQPENVREAMEKKKPSTRFVVIVLFMWMASCGACIKVCQPDKRTECMDNCLLNGGQGYCRVICEGR